MFVVGTLIRFTMEIRLVVERERERRTELKTHYPSDFKYVWFSSVGKCWQNRRVNESCVSRGVYTIIVYALTSTMVCLVFILILISFDFVCLLTTILLLLLLPMWESEWVWGWSYSTSSSSSSLVFKMLLRNVIWLWTKTNMCNHHHHCRRRHLRCMYKVHKGRLNLQENRKQRRWRWWCWWWSMHCSDFTYSEYLCQPHICAVRARFTFVQPISKSFPCSHKNVDDFGSFYFPSFVLLSGRPFLVLELLKKLYFSLKVPTCSLSLSLARTYTPQQRICGQSFFLFVYAVNILFVVECQRIKFQ